MTMRNIDNGRRAAGFTLIELMIAVAIVAILAAIAYPSYRDHVLKTKRAEGKALINRIAAEQERYFTSRNRYTANVTAARPNGLGLASANSERGCYAAQVVINNGGMGYNITAVPQSSTQCGDQAADTKCGTLGMDNLGNKSASGTLGVSGCWQ